MSAKHLRHCLPLSAIKGMDIAKKALECAAVDDHIKGILIKGPTGTAKSVLARSFVNTLPDKDMISIPQNITDEQLFGGLDIEDAIISGRAAVKEGALQRADGNILYLDNINLFDHRKLNAILECVRSEKVIVEREGVSSEYRLRTTVIATMDPAEQPLPDSLADRFDMCVQSYPVENEKERMELIRSNLEFSANPEEFAKRYVNDDRRTVMRIGDARKILDRVSITENDLRKISQVCIDLNVKGHRADISVARVSKALAALGGRTVITDDDIKEASVLCLLHRRRETAKMNTGPEKKEEDTTEEIYEPEMTELETEPTEHIIGIPNSDAFSDGTADDRDVIIYNEAGCDAPGAGTVREITASVTEILDEADRVGTMSLHQIAGTGRRKDILVNKRSGRYRGFKIPKGRTNDPAFDATVRAAAPYQRSRKNKGLSISIESQDIREKIRVKRDSCSFLFAVDVSGSLVETGMMKDIKDGVKAMLMDSYVQRDKVALLTFRTGEIRISVPFTRSVAGICDVLDNTTAGDGTPIGATLLLIRDYLMNYLRKNPKERCYVIMMTDGEVSEPVIRGDPVRELRKIAASINIPNTEWVIVDSSRTTVRTDHAEKLAEMLHARYVTLDELRLA